MSCVPNKPKCFSTTTEADDVLFHWLGKAGVITLNRPKTLNALNFSMAKKIYPQLKSWQSEVSFVIIKGNGEKAFCAGGDIRAVTEAGKKGDPEAANFFNQEYHLNYLIGSLKIPYIALIHGITMGGGVGLSVHGKYRVATERTVFAMPETAIGLFPDVGGSHFLSRLPGNLGVYLGLTGFRLKGLDVMKAGIATHYCNYSQIHKLEEELISLSDAKEIPKVLETYKKVATSSSNPDFVLQPHLADIDRLFQADSIEDILSSLKNDNSDWAMKQLNVLKDMSPVSMKVTLRLLREGAKLSLKECLEMEYRVVLRILEDKDFYEGVRAVLIDRDHKPKWNPSTVEAVTPEKLESFFKPLPAEKEIRL